MTGDGDDVSRPHRDEVFRIIRATLSEVLAVEPARITPASRLAGDLRADSLDLVETLETVEQSLRDRGQRVRVPNTAVAAWHTVEDAVNGVLAALTTVSERPRDTDGAGNARS